MKTYVRCLRVFGSIFWFRFVVCSVLNTLLLWIGRFQPAPARLSCLLDTLLFAPVRCFQAENPPWGALGAPGRRGAASEPRRYDFPRFGRETNVVLINSWPGRMWRSVPEGGRFKFRQVGVSEFSSGETPRNLCLLWECTDCIADGCA